MISKACVVICCLLVTVLAVDHYTDKYDNINIREILENKKLLLAYVDCMLDKGRCTPEGKTLRGHMQDGLETGCEKCTEKQMDLVTTTIDYLIKNEVGIWNDLTAKYDPTGIWKKKYEDLAKEKGIVIP